MSPSLSAGYDAAALDAWTPTMVVDSDVVFSGVVLLFAALALAFVLYHYLTVSRRRQRAGTPSGGRRRRRRHGVLGAGASASVVVDQCVRPVVLPVTLYRARDSEEEALECAVCLAELRDGEAARFLPKCGHGFHAECVGQWLRSHPTCPLCRVDVDVDTLAPLVLLPVPPEPAHYPTNLPTNVLFWGSQDDMVAAGAVGRPSSSDRVAAAVVIDVPTETRPPPAMAPREGDATKWHGLERLRSMMWTRGRRHEVAASSSRSCGRATTTGAYTVS